MDEIREETEYERVVRRMDEAKYSRPSGKPASMQTGTDMAPLFWIAFFAVAFVVLVYLGTNGG